MTRPLPHSLPLAPQQYLAPLLILCISVVAYLFEPQIGEGLFYQRNFVDQGEWWRFISAHFFHTNFHHLVMNNLALAILWALQGHVYTFRTYLLVFFGSGIFACAGVYFFSSELDQYVGLSGAIHGIFIWGALQEILRKEKIGYLLLLGIVVKISIEQVNGTSAEFSEMIEAIIAIHAHLWGAMGGVFMFLMIAWIKSLLSKRVHHSKSE